MKHLIKTVKLKFFCDDANGEYGLTHEDTIDSDNSFNAFWDGRGIFHDIFEHSHEYTNKYFRGEYAMNVGGEMTAMGMMWYYIDVLGIHERLYDRPYQRYTPGQTMKETTLSLVQEALYSGYCNFGYSLESNVPKQRPTDNGELECQIVDFMSDVKEYKDRHIEDEQERAFAEQYRASVTFRKVADLHRYGFRLAERFVPDTTENRNTLTDFIEYWDDLCKRNSAEDMANAFKGITFKIYKEQGEISWTATFESGDIYQYNDVKVKQGRHFWLDDAIKYTPEEY